MFFDKKETAPSIVSSEFFPDHLYVGKTIKLDPSLKFMLKGTVAGFSEDPLIVKGFKYFNIDQNRFEQVDFEKVGQKDFMMLYDSFEKQIYFLNRLTSATIPSGEKPPMATQDILKMDENGVNYMFEDFSGLIETSVSQKDSYSIIGRLIRVYSRVITPDDDEYLICIVDSNNMNVVHYYAGFNINIDQLENLS